MIFDNEEQLRCAFAAFALQGVMSNTNIETLESETERRFIAMTCWQIADMMLGLKDVRTEH